MCVAWSTDMISYLIVWQNTACEELQMLHYSCLSVIESFFLSARVSLRQTADWRWPCANGGQYSCQHQLPPTMRHCKLSEASLNEKGTWVIIVEYYRKCGYNKMWISKKHQINKKNYFNIIPKNTVTDSDLLSQIRSMAFRPIATRGCSSIILTLTLHRLIYYTLDYICHHPLHYWHTI